MYEGYFALRSPAFAKSPDPRFFYRTGGHEQAAAHLLYAAESAEVAVLTGGVGCGKTTVCRVVWRELAERPQFVRLALPHPRVTPRSLLDQVASALGVSAAARSRAQRLDQIGLALGALGESGRTLVLLCDEAQALVCPSVFEELRLLTNFVTEERSLVSILLVGQEELLGKLRHPALRSLRQRVALRYHLRPLEAGETPAYLQHRLAIAGAPDASLFDAPSAASLHRLSTGVPRLLNTLATHALVQAMADGKHRVDEDVVTAVERDLRWPGMEPEVSEEGQPWWT